MFLYLPLIHLLYPLALLVGWLSKFHAALRGKEKSSFPERLGKYGLGTLKALEGGPVVWIHAASAGEVNAILPLCRALRKARPGARLVLTTSTVTGRGLAMEKKAADAVFLAPLDMTPCLNRAFASLKPSTILIAETEFWPNWFRQALKRKVPLTLVNGRVSDRSFPSYRAFRFFFSPVLDSFQACLVQAKGDREKLLKLGVREEKIQVAGQMKYDLNPPDPESVRAFAGELGLGPEDRVLVFGSLREGEDEMALELVPDLLKIRQGVRVILAPRHFKNLDLFARRLADHGIKWSLRSRLDKGDWQVLVLDTIGELALAYALSRGAFVGGTLVPVGGHNVMEPALSSVPVCFGPHTGNVKEAAEALLASGGGFQAAEALELHSLFENFLIEDNFRTAGRKAFEAVSSMRGATDRNLAAVLDILKP